MSSANYDITVDQGSTLRLFLEYQSNEDVGIDLKEHTASMQVRRSYSDDDILLFLTGTTLQSAVTGGGQTGEFVLGSGVSGTGGVLLNRSSTGGSGYTGGIYIDADATTMANIPAGRHLYDLELDLDGVITKILKGRFEVHPEITRR
jgi:hypothetical protein